jgi:hypothetical protein
LSQRFLNNGGFGAEHIVEPCEPGATSCAVSKRIGLPGGADFSFENSRLIQSSIAHPENEDFSSPVSWKYVARVATQL